MLLPPLTRTECTRIPLSPQPSGETWHVNTQTELLHTSCCTDIQLFITAQSLHDTNLPKMDKVLKWAMILMEASKFLMKMLSPVKIFIVGSSLDHMTCMGLPKKSSKLNMSRARSAEGTEIMKLHLN